MSVMCCVYLPEGIVLAADSRLTGTKPVIDRQSGNAANVITFTISDNTQKIVLLNKIKVGISSCGKAILNGKTIADYLRIFEIEVITAEDSVETVAQKLFDYSREHRGDVEFFVCGYIDDVPYAYLLSNIMQKMNTTKTKVKESSEEKETIDYGVSWRGQLEAIKKLLNSEPRMTPNYFLMPLKDGVDFAEFLIDTTIKYERFKDNIQTCGGPIDILVLTKDKAFWYKHKLYESIT